MSIPRVPTGGWGRGAGAGSSVFASSVAKSSAAGSFVAGFSAAAGAAEAGCVVSGAEDGGRVWVEGPPRAARPIAAARQREINTFEKRIREDDSRKTARNNGSRKTVRERQFTRDERRSGGLPSPVRFVFRKPRARRRERRTPATKAGSFVRIGIGRRLRSCRTQEGRTAAAAAGFERYRSHERLLRPAWISSTKNTTPPTRRTR